MVVGDNSTMIGAGGLYGGPGAGHGKWAISCVGKTQVTLCIVFTRLGTSR